MKPKIAVDIDGTLAPMRQFDVDRIYDPYPEAVWFVKELSRHFDVVIHSCRTNEELNKPLKKNLLANLVQKWLDAHGFPEVEIWTGVGKPVAQFYVDDRGVYCSPSDPLEHRHWGGNGVYKFFSRSYWRTSIGVCPGKTERTGVPIVGTK